jgi:hypothetical protein
LKVFSGLINSITWSLTGLTYYTSLDSIYREAGWEKLSTRREVKKLCMFYKLNVGNSPEFLCDLIPPSVGETNNYNCSFSSLSELTCPQLSHTSDEYSKIGLMKVK